jgi:YegS/Rv2252/BmrU family lipid kinase
MSASVLIFANPIAGRGKGRAIAQRLHDRLKQDRFDPRVVFTRADQLDDEALPSDIRAAIAIGGDGTVRGVVHRLFKRYGDATPPTLVVPMGTANLLGRHLGTLWDSADLPEQVARAIGAMTTRHLDAALANDELFLLMAGVGLDARVVHELDRVRSGPIDITSYALPAALALGFYSYPPLTVTVDGKTLSRSLPAIAFVGNVKEYGTGFPILPHARPDDGLLDVCVLPAAGRADAIRHLLRAATGEHVAAEGVKYVKGKEVRIESSEPVPVQIDGEAAGHTPLTCKLLPVRLPFIVQPKD